jgi:hypothetical protein
MSKVAIAGNASGTGTFTIAAPNSNSDRTLNLPDSAGTLLHDASSLAAANLTGDVAAARITGALNATGSAPIYACRAWVNFNGESTVAIRASGNVSSITDNGTGDYTVNFTTAMPDVNYATTAFAAQESGATDNNVTIVGQKGAVSSNYTTSSCRLQCIRQDANIGDLRVIAAAFFR